MPSQLVAELAGLPTALRVRRLCGYLQDHIAGLLDYPEGERPHTDSGFFDLGMSSIHLEQVRQSIIADTAFVPGATSAFDHPTIAEFAAFLERELALQSKPEIEPAASVAHKVAPAATETGQPLLLHTLGQDDIDRLSAHDLERALIEVLS
ncbi:acyl carrier protein [Streptomyces sp. YH02]|uniref:acyl carrier protein n=1 Tax=Streptomyces sp. YH02 TaxID=3256999 RepID=UPI003757BE6C